MRKKAQIAREKSPQHKYPPMRRLKRPNGKDDAYVTLSGTRVFLGRWGSPETEGKYLQEIHQWLARGKTPVLSAPESITVSDCITTFLEYCKIYYACSPKSSFDRVKQSMDALSSMYGKLPVAELTGLHLRALRETLINKRRVTDPDRPALNINTINYRINAVKRMITYCVSLEMCPPEVKVKLQSVENLIAGRCAAPPPRKVHPVPKKDIEAVLPHLNHSLQTLIKLQLTSGCRPGELVILKRSDIHMADKNLWEVELERHKNSFRGHKRVLMFGPRAIEVLRPLILLRKHEEYLFPTTDSMLRRIDASHCHRRPNQKPNKCKTKRKLGPHYDVTSYRRAIARVCATYKIPRWSPHQLRHNFATDIRRQANLEVVRLLLGHSDQATAAIYAERDLDAARELMRNLG